MFVQSVGLQCTSKLLPTNLARSVQLEGPQFTVEGATCYCAAGETQSCVHVTALLFTLAEVSPAACTSLSCAWSRPSAVGGTVAQSSTLDFGKQAGVILLFYIT